MAKYKRLKISDEELKRQLEEIRRDRRAGEGDSPYTQEEFERIYGLRPTRDNVPEGYDAFIEQDWILSDIIDASFYDMEWFAGCAKSKMKPLVKKYSLQRELYIKAYENVLLMSAFNTDLEDQKKRIRSIIVKCKDWEVDRKYEKQMVYGDELRFSDKEVRRYQGQARTRLYNFMRRIDGFYRLMREKEPEMRADDRYVERVVTRNLAFEASYLCLRSEEPEHTFYYFWNLMDSFVEKMKGGE